MDRTIAAAHWRTVEQGQYVYRQGENDGHFYIVAQGEAELTMNYDWPGNLTEMASVLQRAGILGKNSEPLSSQILLGVPKSEGKWEFNLLRLKKIRTFFTSRFFPWLVPGAVSAG